MGFYIIIILWEASDFQIFLPSQDLGRHVTVDAKQNDH